MNTKIQFLTDLNNIFEKNIITQFEAKCYILPFINGMPLRLSILTKHHDTIVKLSLFTKTGCKLH